MSIDAQILRAERHVQIGAVLQRDATLIIERWRKRSLVEQPRAAHLHHAALLDHLPQFLWQLGRSLADSGKHDDAHHPPAIEHGEQRWDLGWSLDEIVGDYNILRREILEYLDETLDRPLRLRETLAIGMGLDEAIAISVTRFVQYRDEQLHEIQASQKKSVEEIFQFRQLFQHASWGVVITDVQDDRLAFVNPAFAAMHGRTVEEMVGMPLAETFAPEARALLPELIRAVETTGEHVYESLHIRKDGACFPTLTDAFALKDEAGAVRYRAANVQDVSGRKNLEASLRAQAESLEKADQRKNEFLATLAHEMRNPLAPLRNALDILRLNGHDPALIQNVREIMDRQVQQLGRLVDDLLDVSRISQGKLTLRRERIDVQALVTQALQTSAPLLEAHQHQLEVQLPNQPLPVEVDRARFIQILVNLLNNAAKYTPDGGRIAVAAALEGGEVVVRVRDNGVGVPVEMQARIFDLFTQIDLGAERTHGGLGIGLTLVRRLVELHGGRITCSSPGAGGGSEFAVYLPALATPRTAPAAPAAAPPSESSRHILIVEDNADGRESLAMLLRLMGHRVETAADGPSGVQAVLTARPQVALIDIGLPGLDGYQVAAQVRAALAQDVFLVALTGHAQPEDRRRALEAGFDNHLTKPIDLDDLRDLLARQGQAHG